MAPKTGLPPTRRKTPIIKAIDRFRSPDCTRKEALAFFESLTHSTTRMGWVTEAFAYDPNVISYILDHADPTKTIDHNEFETQDLWNRSIVGLAGIALSWERSPIRNEETRKHVWATMRRRFPRIINLIWEDADRILFMPHNGLMRNNILGIMAFMVEEGSKTRDAVLKAAFFKYRAFELNLKLWSLDDGEDPEKCKTFTKVSSYAGLERDDGDDKMVAHFRMYQENPPGTCLNICRKLLSACYTSMQTTAVVTMTGLLMHAARLELLEGGIHRDLVKALWRQLKKPTSDEKPAYNPFWLIEKGTGFLILLLSPPAPTPQKEREREQSWLEPLITSEGLVSLLGRYAYELATPAPSKSMPLDQIHAIHRSLSALLYHINSRVLRPTPIYVERHVEPVWMSTLDAILALDRKLSAEAVNMASLWYKFGTDLGLSEFDLRLKAAKKAVLDRCRVLVGSCGSKRLDAGVCNIAALSVKHGIGMKEATGTFAHLAELLCRLDVAYDIRSFHAGCRCLRWALPVAGLRRPTKLQG